MAQARRVHWASGCERVVDGLEGFDPAELALQGAKDRLQFGSSQVSTRVDLPLQHVALQSFPAKEGLPRQLRALPVAAIKKHEDDRLALLCSVHAPCSS